MISPKEAALSAPDFRGFARFGYVSIGVVCAGFGCWAALAPLGGAVVAPARVSVESESKPVQHLEGGIVREILVREAQPVEEGEVLFRLEPIQARANAAVLSKQLDAAQAQDARLVAERDDAEDIVYPPALLAHRDVAETATAMADQRMQFADHRSARRNELGIYAARLEQTANEIAGRKARLAADEAQLASFNSEWDSLAPLYDKKLVTAPRMRALERDRDRVKGEVELARSDVQRLDHSMAETRLLLEQARQHQREAVLQQMADVRARLSEVKEKLAIANDVLNRVDVRAPRKGVVQGLKVHAVGAVVRPGETMAEVVPVGDSLILAAQVSPLNIQDVGAGQRAEVRFSAFAKNAPPIYGAVESVSADILTDETTRQPYYLARLRIDLDAVPPAISRKLTPGMPADVLILSGERTMLQYLLQPMRDRLATSMREH